MLSLFSSCGQGSSGKLDTATSGSITVTADESLKPIVEAEKEVFEALYKDAHLNIIYTNEYDAIWALVNDSARIAIVTRDLLPEEKKPFEEKNLKPRYAPFANDGIAIILNKANTDTIFTVEQLAAILSGKIKTWKELNSRSKADSIRVVFDNPKSGAMRFLTDSLLGGQNTGNHCFAVKDNPSVIDYVESNPNAIGIIGLAWISDRDDTTTHGFLKRIRVADLVPKEPETAEASTMKPYQAYIALKQYPLWRKVHIISREARAGLGTGFASFIASDRGQRIVLKSGLVPATAPVRIIQLNN